MRPALLLFFLMETLSLFSQGGNGFTCQEAACLSQNLGVILNNGGSPPTPPLDFSCGVTHNNLFYSFCAASGSVTLDITPSNCSTGLGVQAVIYETDDCRNFIEHMCISNGNVDPFSINFNATPGQVYILMIDGFSGDICDFRVIGSGIADIQAPPLDPEFDPEVDLGLTICEGEQLEVEVINDDDQECTVYFWEVRSGLRFVTLSENGTTATVYGQASGQAEVCVLVDNFCYETETCFDVTVLTEASLDPIQDVTICDSLVNFCDLNGGFFDPPLNPDPIANGWDYSFHESLDDAERDTNEIVCPYNVNQGSSTIYIRTTLDLGCAYIQTFNMNCNFSQAISTISLDKNVESGLNLCVNEALTISVIDTLTPSCNQYNWALVGDTSIVSIMESGNSVDILALSSGGAELCLTAENACYTRDTCFSIDVFTHPLLEDIDIVVTCDSILDFCDYDNFFDPPLNPAPESMGWQLTFYDNLIDAQNDSNAILCPYVRTSDSEQIWIRMENQVCVNYKSFEVECITANHENSNIDFELKNMPNPFSKSTSIQFTLPKPVEAEIIIRDLSGRTIVQVLGYYQAGLNQVAFSETDFDQSGVYIYTLKSEEGIESSRMLFLKQ